MERRCLVLWYDGDNTRASVLTLEDTPPWRVRPSDVDPRCELLTALVYLPDGAPVPEVWIDNDGQPRQAVVEEKSDGTD